MKMFFALLSLALVPTMAIAAAETAETAAETTTRSSGPLEAAAATVDTAAETLVGTPSAEGSPAKWQLNLSSESTVAARAQKEEGFEAPMTSLTAVGAIYNLTANTQFELRQYIDYASRTETLSGRAQQLHAEKETEMSNLVLRAFTKAFSIGSSKPVSFETRFYLPTDRVGRENKETGLSRTDIWTTWDLNPKWTIGALISPRFQLNSTQNPNAEVGADAEYYRVVATPSVAYNFNDNFSLYYAYNNDVASSQAQRGHYDFDVNNVIDHETGLLWTVWSGKVVINPTIISEVGRTSREAAMFTSDSRVYSDETMTYNMNFYATF